MRPGGAGGSGAMPGGGFGTSGATAGPGRMPGMGPGAGAGMANMRPGMGGAPQGGKGGEMMASMEGRMRPGAGAPGMQGALGRGPGAGPGYGTQDSGPADFHSPEGAVKAFLSALKAKDLDRLNEATALRAQLESSTKNQETFKKIFDLALSDSELDDIAKKLEGYQIAGENPQVSTGRIDVILRKAGQNGAYFQRKVTVRHEKKGWGVLDISGPSEFRSMRPRPLNRGGTGSGKSGGR
jgi:hypothetical protein